VKPKIADLERLETKRSDRGWMATLDEHRFLWTCLPDLLRLARAAKGLIDNQQTHRPRCHDCAACDIRDAADAFDWSDE